MINRKEKDVIYYKYMKIERFYGILYIVKELFLTIYSENEDVMLAIKCKEILSHLTNWLR